VGIERRETHPIFFHHVLTGVRNGREAVRRRSPPDVLGPVGGHWLGLDVGSDVALANAVGREIIAAGLANRAFIERATTGFAAYQACVEKYTLDYAERTTGCRPRRSATSPTRTRAPIGRSSAGRSGSPSTTTPSTTCWR
jgi:formate dehydrogenase major subunit